MNEDQVLAALYACGHEVGVEQGASEVRAYSPEDARWVLELLDREDEDLLWDSIPLLRRPDDFELPNPGHPADEAIMALQQAGLQAYDGIAEAVDVVGSYLDGYYDGVRDGVEQTARRRALRPNP